MAKLQAWFLFTLTAFFAASCATPKVTSVAVKNGTAPQPPFSLTREMAATRSQQIASVTYTLWFGLDASAEEFRGRAVIHFQLQEKAREEGKDLFLDFDGGRLRTLSVNGIFSPPDAHASHYDGKRIRLKMIELQSGSNRIEISYTHPYSASGNGLHRFVDPEDGQIYIYSNLEPFYANRVFPCFDQPDLKAPFEVTVDAPEEWTVIANLLEREVNSVDGKKSWAFPPSPPLPTYVFALIAGPYHSWKADAHGIPMRLYSRKSLSKYVDSSKWFEITRAGLDLFSVELGYPYPFAKYDQILAPEFNSGAMENAGAVTFSERFIYRSKATEDQMRGRANTILHEMAHMWFGNFVTPPWWNGLWLNESLATFLASWAMDKLHLFKGVWPGFFGMKTWGYWEDQLVTTHPIEGPVTDTSIAKTQFDGITYAKGAAAIQQLAFFLGEDDFKEGLQRFFQKFAFRNATLSDFMRTLSEASGNDLAHWQRLWFQTAGLNEAEASWSCEDESLSANPGANKRSGALIKNFTLFQRGAEGFPTLRPHRMRIGFYYFPKEGPKKSNALRLKKSVDIEYSKAETPVAEAIGLPCPDLLLTNQEDQDYVKAILDPESLKTAKKYLSRLEDPFARQQIWHSLKERLRDARIAAHEFIEIVLEHAAHEQNTQVLKSVLSGTFSERAGQSTAMRFLSPDARKETWNRLEIFYFKQLQNAPAGSDLQLTWFHAFLQLASSPSSNQFLQKLLQGKARLPRLKIDTDRRWEILQALARMGTENSTAENSATMIAAEKEKDPSDTGNKSAIAAEVRIPTAENKAKWLARIIQKDSAFKDAELFKAAGHYHLLGQEEFTRAAVDPFFEALDRLSASGDEDYLNGFVSRFFPSLCDPLIPQKIDAYLTAHPAAPPAVLKELRVQRQEVERCLRHQPNPFSHQSSSRNSFQ